MALDRDLGLLLGQTISWERSTGQDGYGDQTYAAAVDLDCHIEEATIAERSPDATQLVPRHCVYLDGADANVQLITLNDRFTAAGVGGGQPVQPQRVNPIYGPDGAAWLVEVTL